MRLNFDTRFTSGLLQVRSRNGRGRIQEGSRPRFSFGIEDGPNVLGALVLYLKTARVTCQQCFLSPVWVA